MPRPLKTRGLACLGGAAYLLCACNAVSISRALYAPSPGAFPGPALVRVEGMPELVAQRSQAFRPFRQPAAREQSATFQEIRSAGDSFQVRYGFRNFNRDALSIDVRMPRRDVDSAIAEYGYRPQDFQQLDAWYQREQKQLIDGAQDRMVTGSVTAAGSAELQRKLAQIKGHNAAVEATLNRDLQALAQQYREKRTGLYSQAGFKYKDSRTVEANIPEISRRNAGRMRPASLAFAGLVSEREYGMEELIGAVTAMAQTAMRYEIPATTSEDRVIAGVLPPPKSFVTGQGDCDTKSALIGSLLLNWPNIRMVGLSIPQHYLIAVHRIPGRGEVYIEHHGIPYVMIEAAGPAWIPPGKVGDFTEQYLSSGKLFTVQPL